MQTAITFDQPFAVAGALADEGPREILTGIVSKQSGAPAGINMGLAIFHLVGTDLATKDVKEVRSALGAASRTNLQFQGVCFYDASQPEPYDLATGFNYVQGDAIPVLKRGRVWVKVEDAVTPASGVRVRIIASGGEIAGSFRGAADSTDTIVIQAARWLTAADAGGLALLDLISPIPQTNDA